MVVITGTVLAVGGLIVAGTAAAGWLASSIGQAFQGAGVQQHYNTIDEVSDSLQNIGRPDLAYSLNYEIARGNTAAFTTQATQATSLTGQVQEIAQIIPLAIFAMIALKVVK